MKDLSCQYVQDAELISRYPLQEGQSANPMVQEHTMTIIQKAMSVKIVP